MIKRGEVFYANLSPVVGSEQGGIRPVLIIQNNKGNLFSPTLIVAPITRNVSKRLQPTQVLIEILHNECRTPSLYEKNEYLETISTKKETVSPKRFLYM